MRILWLPVVGIPAIIFRAIIFSTIGPAFIRFVLVPSVIFGLACHLVGVEMAWAGTVPFRCAGDELRLRSGKLLDAIRILSVDEDGVVLDDGRRFPLDSIQSAKLEQQARFDELHGKISLDLFRLRVRLQRDDVESLSAQLEKLYPVFQNRNSRSAVVVMLARLRHCVQQGHWDLAIGAHFRLFTLATNSTENASELKRLGYRIDNQSGMTGEIFPGGVSKAQVLENWESILKAYRGLPDPHPSGLEFYFFQLAKIAEVEVEPEISSRRLKLTSLERLLLDHSQVALTGTEPEELKRVRDQLADQAFQTGDTLFHKAFFYLARGLVVAQMEAKGGAGNPNQGLLDLLRIHAEFGKQTESMSAAGLFHAARLFRARGMPDAEKSVSEELFTRYPSSDFAKQLKLKEAK